MATAPRSWPRPTAPARRRRPASQHTTGRAAGALVGPKLVRYRADEHEDRRRQPVHRSVDAQFNPNYEVQSGLWSPARPVSASPTRRSRRCGATSSRSRAIARRDDPREPDDDERAPGRRDHQGVEGARRRQHAERRPVGNVRSRAGLGEHGARRHPHRQQRDRQLSLGVVCQLGLQHVGAQHRRRAQRGPRPQPHSGVRAETSRRRKAGEDPSRSPTTTFGSAPARRPRSS